MMNLLEIYKEEFGRTKKKFGQHFLTNQQFLGEIVDAAGAGKGVDIVEIGPGCGVLTEKMLSRGSRLCAIEIDTDLAEFLPRYLFIYPDFSLVNKDFMKITDEDLPFEKFVFVGNLPYNISVDILMHCANFINRVDKLVFMFQKEVADRINAKPKTKAYSSVSVISSYFYEIKKVRDISGGNFWPNTKVYSSVLSFTPKERFYKDREKEKDFVKFINRCFIMKRKTLKNNLKHIEGIEDIISSLGLKESVRAEEIEADFFVNIYEAISNSQS